MAAARVTGNQSIQGTSRARTPRASGVRFGEDPAQSQGVAMTRPMRTLTIAVALALASTAVFGVVGGGDRAEAATQHTLRIPASAFSPRYSSTVYTNTGFWLQNASGSPKSFHAPVLLNGNSATIQSVQLHYVDNSDARICIYVDRVTLKTGVRKTMSNMCTRNALPGTRTRTDTTIHPDTVGPGQSVHVFVHLPDLMTYLHGVTIVYTVDG